MSFRAPAGYADRISRFGPVAVLVAVSSALTAAFIANSPKLDRFPDTVAYEAVADHLPGSFISSGRLPGYPILIAVASWLPGGRDVALIALQSLMVVAAVVLTYYIARATLGRIWMAFLVALVIAADVLMAGFARVAMSEAMAVILTLSLTAVTFSFLSTRRLRDLWLMAGLMLGLALTRPEWAFLAILLVPYVLVVLARRKALSRRLLGHGMATLAAVLLGLGAYSTGNLIVNGYFGMSSIGNITLLGKVMVYDMVREAPPPYSTFIPLVESYMPRLGPWPLILNPPFDDRNHVFAGEFARAVIVHDPAGYASHLLGTVVSSNTEYDAVFLRIRDDGPLAGFLKTILTIDSMRYAAFVLIPALGLAWVAAGLLAPDNRRSQFGGALGVIVLYGTLAVAAAGYDEFGRIHMPINPGATIIVIGSVLLNLLFAFRKGGAVSLVALLLVVIEIGTVGMYSTTHSTRLTAIALLVIAVLQAVMLVRWFGPQPTPTEAAFSARVRLGSETRT